MSIMPNRRLSWSYLASSILLSVHEVDSAHWNEWDIFSIPGGADMFVFLHLGIFFLLFWGYGQVLSGTRAGFWLALAAAAGSLFAGAVHGTFLLLGRPEFRSGVSAAILVALTLSGAILLRSVVFAMRRPATC